MLLRKITSPILGVIVIVFAFIIVPWLFIILNNFFGLPVISNLFLKIISTLLVCFCLGIIFYTAFLHIRTGRVTPLPVIEHPKKFIVTGLYHYCRNPMYLAEIFLLLSVFLFFGHLLLLLYPFLFFLKVHILVVFFEEPELKETFGESYLKYFRSVPRWLPKF